MLISLVSSLFNMVVVKALECMSVKNRKCMPRPKILDINEVGEPVYYPYVLEVVMILMIPWQNCVFLRLLKM